jgi:(1->4)-alpha-D-glucan 1-alpha-D-glucosylmutase
MSPDALLDDWRSGAPKLALTVAGLRLRKTMPSLFADGAYIPLQATGPAARHVMAFARRSQAGVALVVVPRFVLELAGNLDQPQVPARCWNDTAIGLPEEWGVLQIRNAVTGAVHDVDREISVSTLLHSFPVALLIKTP